jgi:quinol---cytochrome-c reductase cytochrome c subunit
MRLARCLTVAAALVASAGAAPAAASDVTEGQLLFQQRCSTCHGMDARGVDRRGPSLVGVGEQAADFYLRTGRMPLAEPGDEPVRAAPAYSARDIDRMVAYIASLGGPAIPQVDVDAGSLTEGRQLFAVQCAGCHHITGSGGVVTGGSVPALDSATPTQIAEAIRIGPYLMPRFGPGQIDQHGVDSIARYIVETTDRPDDAGGLPLGHLGPIPEGAVAWLVAMGALVLVARLTGSRDA